MNYSTSPRGAGHQTVRFVGGPYHGRTLAVSDRCASFEAAVLRNKPADFWSDGTLKQIRADKAVRFETVTYHKVWLERNEPSLMVRELVMLHSVISPYGSEAIQRWQELRQP